MAGASASVASTPKARVKRRWGGTLSEFLWACAGWVLLWPLTRVVPRRANLVVFRGRDGGKFLDNCKHLFAEAQRARGIEPIFLAFDTTLRDRLRAQGARAEHARGWAATWHWLRAGTIVVDNVDWLRGMRFPASRGARIVQLWHGIPLKQVQLGRIAERSARQPRWERIAFRIYLQAVGRLAPVDWFLSTARLVTDRAFSGSFRYRHVSHAGYPRNDVLFEGTHPLADQDVDPRALDAIAAHRAHGSGRVLLYAPTFRESLEDPFAAGRIDLQALSHAATRLDLLLLIKLHPWMHGRVHSGELPGIVFVAPDSDAYPLMCRVDGLLTDYSSIFFDFLLLDRPVLFFPYDLATYLSDERPMYFDYDAMTPGPKPTTIDTLVAELERFALGEDAWRNERKRVRDLVFDAPTGGAGRRLLAELFPTSA